MSFRPSVRVYHRGCHWTDFVKYDTGNFCEKEDVCFTFFGSDIYNATILRKYCCAPMSTFSVLVTLLTATCVYQQCKGKALLIFHGNSGYANVPHRVIVRGDINSFDENTPSRKCQEVCSPLETVHNHRNAGRSHSTEICSNSFGIVVKL